MAYDSIGNYGICDRGLFLNPIFIYSTRSQKETIRKGGRIGDGLFVGNFFILGSPQHPDCLWRYYARLDLGECVG